MGLATAPIKERPARTSNIGPTPHRWTREEYHRFAVVGLIGPEKRVELIDGEIIDKVTPQLTPHTVSTRKTERALKRAFGDGFDVRYQMPLVLSKTSEPEPDILVMPGDIDDYEDHQPGPSEALLVAEISDSTLAFDRKRKGKLYANAGITDYWIVNIKARCLEVYREPQAKIGYQSQTILTEAETVTPLAAPNAVVRVGDLLPRPHRE